MRHGRYYNVRRFGHERVHTMTTLQAKTLCFGAGKSAAIDLIYLGQILIRCGYALLAHAERLEGQLRAAPRSPRPPAS